MTLRTAERILEEALELLRAAQQPSVVVDPALQANVLTQVRRLIDDVRRGMET